MISSFLHEAVRLLTRYENLALVVSALLGSAAIVCAAFSLAAILRKRSAKARGMVWRMAAVMLLVLAGWRLMPEMQEPVAAVQWEVRVEPLEFVQPLPMPREPLVIPPPSLWSRITRVADEQARSVWVVVGATMLLWKVLAAFAGLAWLWRRSTEADEKVQKLGEALDASKSMRYRVAEKIASPMLTGWRRPVVWLPVASRGWDEARLTVVLRHELAHARHADVLWHWLGTLAVCLWWWQPLAWLARRGLRLESEQAADDAAVLQSGDTQAYARTLVEIAAGLPSRLKHAAGVTMFGGGQVKQRVEALLRTNRWRGRIGLGAMVLMALLGLALALLVATTFEFTPKKPVYRSLAKLVAGSRMVVNGNLQWQEQLQDFYGTIIETIESAEMQRKAKERVKALHPGLKEDRHVEIRVAQTKGSAIFNILATSDDPKHTQIFLNSLLDEFIAFRQSIREQAQGKVLSIFLQEVANKQKVMEEKATLLEKFMEKHNILSITNEQNELAHQLTSLTSQRSSLREHMAEISAATSAGTLVKPRSQTTLANTAELSDMESLFLKTKAEQFALKSERVYLLRTRQPDHPEIQALDDKISRTEHLLMSASEVIREEMEAQHDALQKQLQLLEHEIAEIKQQALDIGTRLSEHKKLETEATVAKEAYQRMPERAENFQNMFNTQSDYVAIQERATTAAEHTESSLFPVWKLWAPKPNQAAATD